MIADIEAEGVADQKKHDWCADEQGTNRSTKGEKEGKRDRLVADIGQNEEDIIGEGLISRRTSGVALGGDMEGSKILAV